MTVSEIRKMDTPKLAEAVNSLREEITELRRRIHMGETQNVRIVKSKRKDLARMLTIMSEQLSKEKM